MHRPGALGGCTLPVDQDEAPVSVKAFIVGESQARLWGLTSGERIARQLQAIGEVQLADRWEAVARAERALLLRADYLYEIRTLASLLQHRGLLMDGETPAAAFVDGRDAERAKALLESEHSPREVSAPAAHIPENDATPASAAPALENDASAAYASENDASPARTAPALENDASSRPSAHAPDSSTDRNPANRETRAPRISDAAAAPRAEDLPPLPIVDLSPSSAFEGELRKSAPPLLRRIAPGGERALEDLLYGASYKGITDFVTKWWWPAPAKQVARWCASLGLAPNAVTLFGLALMLAVCWLFHEGWLFWGLLLGWAMTLLDTVDGKLARVTVRSSKLGHWLDHGMDILHPPFWYWLWGLSLTDFQPWFGIGFDLLLWCIFAGYIAGRLIEGAFEGLGRASLFAWRPFDAWFRLIAARRNPCLALLTAGWLLGSPALGFWLVALWTAACSLVLLARLAFGCWARLARGPLSSWLAEPDAAQRHPRSHRAFSSTRKAYG